jgi:hypothetical protein
MGAASCDITYIHQIKNKHDVHIVLFHGFTGLFQAIPAHPVKVDPFLPIHSHHSEFRHFGIPLSSLKWKGIRPQPRDSFISP